MTEGGGRARLFYALWPPPTLAHALAERAARLHGACGGRRMRTETLHLTLAFLGEVDMARLAALEDVGARAAGAAPRFRLTIDAAGYWAHNRIVWIGCRATPAPLGELVGRLREALQADGFRVEARAFVAHLTVLRNARCPASPEAPAPPLEWPVEELRLVRSQLAPAGAGYSVQARWPLG